MAWTCKWSSMHNSMKNMTNRGYIGSKCTSSDNRWKSRKSGLQMGQAARNKGSQTRKLQTHSSPSRVMKYGVKSPQKPEEYFQGRRHIPPARKTGRFPFHDTTVQQFLSILLHTAVHLYQLRLKSWRHMEYLGKISCVLILSYIAHHIGLNENPHTALKCHQIGNMTQTLTGLPGIWVETILSNSAHHHGPHSLLNLLCQQDWPAGMQQESVQHRSCGSAHSAISPLKFKQHLASHMAKREAWQQTRASNGAKKPSSPENRNSHCKMVHWRKVRLKN